MEAAIVIPMEVHVVSGTLTIRTTKSSGEIRDLRYRLIWSAWLDGRLVGKGHCFRVEEAIEQAQDLLDPEEVERIEVLDAG